MEISLDMKTTKKPLYDDATGVDKLRKVENNGLYKADGIYGGRQGRKLELVVENNGL